MKRLTLIATALGSTLALTLGTGTVTAAAPAAHAPVTAAAVAVDDGDGSVNEFLSAPPDDLLGRRATPEPRRQARPKPPRTKGKVTGQVVGPKGTPIRNALVTGVRFSDLGLPVDLSVEKRVLARTGKSGRFTLRQFREPYLIRICSEARSEGGGAKRRSGECDLETTKRFTPSYVGPDGTQNSWMRHTRLFPAQPRGRSIGRVVVRPPAVVTGTFRDGANRRVYLSRIDGSIAATTIADSKGDYRVEVAPGPYRLEADHDEGLRTDSTVPGYRSKRFVARAGRAHRDDFRTRHAGIIRGQVTSNGVPLPEQFLAVLDSTGRFAAGVVTNELGRYVISSLEPGTYSVTTSYAGSSYVPAAQAVSVTQKDVATADLALDPGRSISFIPSDTVVAGANGSVDAELRNAEGRVVKVFQGNPASLSGSTVTFAGLPAGFYRLLVRRSDVPADTAQVEFPWAERVIDLSAAPTAVLGAVPLDQPTRNLSGTLPVGGQLKLTALPEDAYLRAAYVDGDQATPMAVSWTVQESAAQYVVRGVVPGTYAAAVTTALRTDADGRTETGGNLAATHSTVIVDGPAPIIAFTAPLGGSLRARLRYAGNNRPVIAPFGLRVTDPGDQSWLFPTVSGPQRYGKALRVDRLHAGTGTARLFDLDELLDEFPDVLIPDELVSTARNEPGTSYWYTSGKKSFTLTSGGRSKLGVVKVKLHGALGG